MNKNLNEYTEQLEKERATILEEMKGVGIVTNTKNPDEWQATPTEGEHDLADANEVADRIESFEENAALVSQLETRLREIDHALKGIREQTFGLCEVCKKPIEADRLHANAAARTCKEHLNSKLPTPTIV
jgi:RNA polymerase-binding transcription factor DksA